MSGFLKEYTIDLKKNEWAFTNIKALSLNGAALFVIKTILEKRYCSIISIASNIVSLYGEIINYDFGYINLIKDAYIFYVDSSIDEKTVNNINDRFIMLVIEKIAEISEEELSPEVKREWVAAILKDRVALKIVDISEEQISQATFNKALVSELSNIFVRTSEEYSRENITKAKPNYGTEGYLNELKTNKDKLVKEIMEKANKEFCKDDSKKKKEFIGKSESEIFDILIDENNKKQKIEEEKNKEIVNVKYKLCNGLDGLECVSNPIITYEKGTPISANSYVVKFKVFSIKIKNKDIIKVAVDFVWRRWVFEHEKITLSNEIETDNNVYISRADSNFVKVISYTRDSENKKRFILDRDKHVLEEFQKGLNIEDVLDCSSKYLIDDERGYVAIPINQQIVGLLSSKSISDMGTGSLDKEYIFNQIVDSLKSNLEDKTIKVSKSLDKVSDKIVEVSKYYGAKDFKTSKMTIGSLNNMSKVLIYYVEKESHINEFKKALNSFVDDKSIGKTFRIKHDETYESIYEYNLGTDVCELKIIFKVCSLFNEPVKKIEGEKIKAHDIAYKKYINLIKETLIENKLRPTDNIMNLVDMNNYAKTGKGKGYDPYPTVKRAFLFYNQNVQIFSALTEFTNRWDSFELIKADPDIMKKHKKAIKEHNDSFLSKLKNSLADLFQKKGVICAIKNLDKVQDNMFIYGDYKGAVGIDFIRVGDYVLLAAVRYTKLGLEYLTLDISNGTTPVAKIMSDWTPIWRINETINRFYKINKLNPESKKVLLASISNENNILFKKILNLDLIPVMTSKIKKTFEKRLGEDFNPDKKAIAIEENNVNIHYVIINEKSDIGLKMTLEQGLFKSEEGYYLSVGKRGDSFKNARVESTRFGDLDEFTKKRRAYIFIIENCQDEKKKDFIASLFSKFRNLNIAFESSTITPHLIYFLNNINSEIEKAKMV